MRRLLFVVALALAAPAAGAQRSLPAAISTDPPRDTVHPARMEVLHIPSGGVQINGVAYIPPGAGVHPTLVLLHGFPGNEKNLDLAQAVRRAGWNVITFNYRGTWGSPGTFRFRQNIEDADAVLAYLRDPANARKLGVDTTRLAIGGHSMGGWVTALTASHDHRLRGAILISAADMATVGRMQHAQLVTLATENMETLAGVTPESVANDLASQGDSLTFAAAAPGLAHTPLLVLTSDDGLAPGADRLVAAVRKLGNTHVTTEHVATDHSWSDRRIALETAVLRWLDTIR